MWGRAVSQIFMTAGNQDLCFAAAGKMKCKETDAVWENHLVTVAVYSSICFSVTLLYCLCYEAGLTLGFHAYKCCSLLTRAHHHGNLCCRPNLLQKKGSNQFPGKKSINDLQRSLSDIYSLVFPLGIPTRSIDSWEQFYFLFFSNICWPQAILKPLHCS